MEKCDDIVRTIRWVCGWWCPEGVEKCDDMVRTIRWVCGWWCPEGVEGVMTWLGL